MADAVWLDDDEQALWRSWRRVGHDLDAVLARQMGAESELSMPDYVVLVCLTESATGSVRASELADQLSWERSRLSHHIARMEKRGLVERAGCEEDRRGAYVKVTREGRAAIEAAAPGHVRTVRRLFLDGLDATDRADFARILGRLESALDADRTVGSR